MQHQEWDHRTAYERNDLELARLEVELAALQEEFKGMDGRIDRQGYMEVHNKIEANKDEREVQEGQRHHVKAYIGEIESTERLNQFKGAKMLRRQDQLVDKEVLA